METACGRTKSARSGNIERGSLPKPYRNKGVSSFICCVCKQDPSRAVILQRGLSEEAKNEGVLERGVSQPLNFRYCLAEFLGILYFLSIWRICLSPDFWWFAKIL